MKNKTNQYILSVLWKKRFLISRHTVLVNWTLKKELEDRVNKMPNKIERNDCRQNGDEIK